MITKLHRRFNFNTRLALFENVLGYVDRNKSKEDELKELKKEYGLDRVYRFDLGENAFGYSPKVFKYIDSLINKGGFMHKLNEYPESSYPLLCRVIGERFGVNADEIVLATGSEYLIDLVARVVIKDSDFFVTVSPTFFLFDEYSSRCGGIQFDLDLKEKDNYQWTLETTHRLEEHIEMWVPRLKLIWIANPNNPTGQIIPRAEIEAIVRCANEHSVFVVVDEAYGEYMDTDKEVVSASYLLKDYENLIVFRTMSKGYGLAGMRLGYMMTKSPIILKAIMTHRNCFPVTQLALVICHNAFSEIGFLVRSRRMTKRLFEQIKKKIVTLPTFRIFPTYTNVFVLKNHKLTATELSLKFQTKGIITSPVYVKDAMILLRITVRDEPDNNYFCEVCAQIDKEVEDLPDIYQ